MAYYKAIYKRQQKLDGSEYPIFCESEILYCSDKDVAIRLAKNDCPFFYDIHEIVFLPLYSI